MIFNVPGHISYIRNGLTRLPADNLNSPVELRIIKTQTRSSNRGTYKVGKDYAVQRKRGVKAEPDLRIVMDRIWEETPQYWCGSYYGFCISQGDARAEGNYSPKAYEEVFRERYPIWPGGGSRWVFEFHVIEGVKNRR